MRTFNYESELAGLIIIEYVLSDKYDLNQILLKAYATLRYVDFLYILFSGNYIISYNIAIFNTDKYIIHLI